LLNQTTTLLRIRHFHPPLGGRFQPAITRLIYVLLQGTISHYKVNFVASPTTVNGERAIGINGTVLARRAR